MLESNIGLYVPGPGFYNDELTPIDREFRVILGPYPISFLILYAAGPGLSVEFIIYLFDEPNFIVGIFCNFPPFRRTDFEYSAGLGFLLVFSIINFAADENLCPILI